MSPAFKKGGLVSMVAGKRYQVFAVREAVEKNEKKSVWIKCGSAWINRDGSLNVYLDVLPIDGKLHVREAIDERRAESTNGTGKGASNGSAASETWAAAGGH